MTSSDAFGFEGGSASTRLVTVRHGETDWNVTTRIQGQLDISLNDVGRWQAGRVAAALKSEGLDVIYSSDLSRAYETARAIGEACRLTVHREAGLRERAFGCFEGRTWDEIAERWPEASARWRAREANFKPEGGESLVELRDRVIATCESLAARHRGECVAIVAHGGVMDVLRRESTRMELSAPRTWSLANAAIHRLLHADQGFSLVGWGDASHLQRDHDGGEWRGLDDVSVGGLRADDGVGHAA